VKDFDTAIRENRRGVIKIDPGFLRLAMESTGFSLLHDRMLVTSRTQDDIRALCWEGYSPDFEPLVLGAAAPLYQAVFGRAADGSTTLTFLFAGSDHGRAA
jgi:hypothetical protein